jgi:hypothetical protein
MIVKYCESCKSAIKLPKSTGLTKIVTSHCVVTKFVNSQGAEDYPNYCDRCQEQDIAELLEDKEHIQSSCSIYPESVRDYLKYIV